jgi:hypothetical protein
MLPTAPASTKKMFGLKQLKKDAADYEREA